MVRLRAEQLAGFRRQTPPPTPEPSEAGAPAVPAPHEAAPGPERGNPRSARLVASGQVHAIEAPAEIERHSGAKAVLHLPRPLATRLRAVAEATAYPLSRLVTAAVLESMDALRSELDGGVPLLRSRGAPGREAFTFWLPYSTRAALKELAGLGGISASEVAARALAPFLDRLESDLPRTLPQSTA